MRTAAARSTRTAYFLGCRVINYRSSIYGCITSATGFTAHQSVRRFSFTPLSPKTLSGLTNLPKLSQEEPHAITEIWNNFHTGLPSAHGVSISSEQGALMRINAKTCPMLILPVFKDTSSFINMLVQFQDQYLIMTYLEEYRNNPTAASSWLCLAMYDELSADKDLTLVRVDFLPHLSKKEAIVLTKMLTDGYAKKNDLYSFIETFNHRPQAFNFEEYMAFMKQHYLPLFLAEDSNTSDDQKEPV